MVGKLEDAARLIETLVKENTSVFGENIREYREERRASSARPLTAAEAGQVAASMASVLESEGGASSLAADPGAVLAGIQNSELRAVDEVPMQEVLLAAGLATAPALLDAVKRLVALIEMDNDAHREARESGELADAIATAAAEFDHVEIGEMRARASAALEHFQASAGVAPGEARSLILRMLGQALGQAVAAAPNIGSAFASLIGSDELTGGAE